LPKASESSNPLNEVEAVKTFLGGIEMLGKAKEIQIYSYCSQPAYSVEVRMEMFKRDHPNAEIEDIKYNVICHKGDFREYVLIIYKEAE
jgi:hypothetical protein